MKMDRLHLLFICVCMCVSLQLTQAYTIKQDSQPEKRSAVDSVKSAVKNDNDAMSSELDAIIGYDIEHPKLIEELDDFIHSLAKKVSDASSSSAAVSAAPEVPLSRIFDSGKSKVSDETEKQDEEFYRELMDTKMDAGQEKKSLGMGNGQDISMQELDSALGMLLNYYVSGNDQYGRKRSNTKDTVTESSERRFERMAAKRHGIPGRRYGKDHKRSYYAASDSDGFMGAEHGNLPRGFGRRYGRRDSDAATRGQKRAVDLSKLSAKEKKKMLAGLLAKINAGKR